jgi:DivIVA domain-containing protein
MKLTPLDIYQKEFRRKKLNGLDPEDVEHFLFQVAEGLEALLHENAQLTQRLERGAPQTAEEGTGVGSEIGDGPARQAAEQEVEKARQEARRIADEARAKARAIVDDARAQAQRIGEAGQARGAQPAVAAATDERMKQFARDYQSMLVKHLSQVTHHLGHEEDDEPSSLTAAPVGAPSAASEDSSEVALARTPGAEPAEDRTTELGTRP